MTPKEHNEESQESINILDVYMDWYGVGTLSSSPAPGETQESDLVAPPPCLPTQATPGNVTKVHQAYVGSRLLESESGPHKLHRASRSASSTEKHYRKRDHGDRSLADITPRTNAVTEVASPVADPVFSAQLNPAPSVLSEASNEPCSEVFCKDGQPQDIASAHSQIPEKAVNMDPSQSPTQSNDGRSYEQYYRSSPRLQDELPSTALGLDDHFPSSQEQKTLNEEDTGAVIFGTSHIAAHATQSTVPDDSGLVDFGLVLQGDAESQQHAPNHGSFQFPETPAQPKNPFAAHDRAQLLGGSQLFRQTQFSSAVRGGISPTSSRPSPNDFQPNSISPNPVISSPLKARGLPSSPMLQPTSSPEREAGILSEPPGADELRFEEPTPKGPVVQNPLQYIASKKHLTSGPMEQYEPMKLSQLRRETSNEYSNLSSDGETSDDDDFRRRRRAEEKKSAAKRKLSSISFKGSSESDEVEVPSTNKKGKQSPASLPGDHATSKGEGTSTPEGQDTVADSQKDLVVAQSLEAAETASGDDLPTAKSVGDGGHTRGEVLTRSPGSAVAALDRDGSAFPATWSNPLDQGEAIPETSPAPQQPRPFSTFQNQSSTSESLVGFSYPTLQSDGQPQASRQGVPSSKEDNAAIQASVDSKTRGSHHDTSTDIQTDLHPSYENTAVSSLALPEPKADGLPAVPSSVPSSPPALSTRARKRARVISSGQTEPGAPSSSAMQGSTSSLSTLSVTPTLSEKTTPATDDCGEAAHLVSGDHSSPAVSRDLRRKATKAAPKTITYGGRTRVATRSRKPPVYTEPPSTDELGRSPSSTPTFDRSVNAPLAGIARPGRAPSRAQSTSRDRSLGAQQLFLGMAFAISFQSEKPGENAEQYHDRMATAKELEHQIIQEGGTVLSSGFDELFDHPPIRSTSTSPASTPPDDVDIPLRSAASSIGFTALIADGHSRKVKYMQALALGLPCIASRWISTCLEKKRVVDWTPYLLCAGQSSFLGDAIRSRNIVPYDASSAKLSDVLEHRPRFLAGNRILLVMKKTDESKKMVYVFLAWVLGASLSRVYNLKDARVQLKAMEAVDRPYDWVYVDGKSGQSESLFTTGATNGKKRKRSSTTTSGASTPPKRIKTLSDELVIQSLILGRLIDEEDGIEQ
ncbi:uncharacterized protein E0L32_001760 [Thyridium curvatum]|nr:uncharacterized protein E0L32_001760 [Thyridium curvatum]TPX08185.1 hypothetical protein E0L32_001760 [Thyridium curvatum]